MADRALTYKVGDLVRWFEPYADGFMTRDAGKGIVLKINKYSLQLKSEEELSLIHISEPTRPY